MFKVLQKYKMMTRSILLFAFAVCLTSFLLLISLRPGQLWQYQQKIYEFGKNVSLLTDRRQESLKLMGSDLAEMNRVYQIFNGPEQWREQTVNDEIASAAMGGFILDENLRLISAPDKNEVPCPPQKGKTAVLFVFGQSNSSNFHEKKYKSEFGDKVVNYINGKCYIASSPLLGGHGIIGESSTLFANKLLKNKIFDHVVLISTAFGGTSVSLWEKGQRFNIALKKSLEDVALHYKITHMVWQNGEADAAGHKSAIEYKAGFYSMLSTIRASSVSAPIFIAVGTKCNVPNTPIPNPTSEALKALPNAADGLFAGVDTDKYITSADRFDDCHFNQSGQEKYTDLLLRVFQNYQKNNP